MHKIILHKIQIAVIIILSVFLMISTGWGATYYVDKNNVNASDSNSGTLAQPWKTIQKAANTMAAGDTLKVNAGNYSGERVQVAKSGTAGMPITYEAQGTVVMKGFNIKANFITVRGFEIADTDYVRWNKGVSSGIYIKGSNVIVENNYIHDCSLNGITLYGTPSEPTITSNCIVRNNRLYRNEMVGIEVSGRNNLIESNEVWGSVQCHPKVAAVEGPGCPLGGLDADGMRFFGSGHTFRKNYTHDISVSSPENITPHIDAFQTWSGGDYEGATNMIFEQNRVFLMSEPPSSLVSVYSFMLEDANNITIKNNLLESWSGINTGGGGNSNLKIYSNTFRSLLSFKPNYSPRAIALENVTTAEVYNNLTIDYSWAHYYVIGGSNISYDYNLMWNSNGSTPGLSGYTVQSHDKRGVDPKFVAKFTDLHLQSISPAIDAGKPVSTVTNDFDYNPRPRGTGHDIGAYEFSVKPSPPSNLRVP